MMGKLYVMYEKIVQLKLLGTIAGNTRWDIEKQLGESVVSGKKAQDYLVDKMKRKIKFTSSNS